MTSIVLGRSYLCFFFQIEIESTQFFILCLSGIVSRAEQSIMARDTIARMVMIMKLRRVPLDFNVTLLMHLCSSDEGGVVILWQISLILI